MKRKRKITIEEVCKKHGWVLAGPDDPIYQEPLRIIFRSSKPKREMNENSGDPRLKN